ncbi:hypothetical protein HGP28_12965 [Vibrio sp. SM6]|uniref:Cytochrome oxidase biogenesis cluster protein n=1 Tax=Vibrio agarilyticus TaxID=2726741 RepID=A0A7X8TSK1_9VIBR|nr:hypothetical protein [Vibrio agarilyticus]NLS13802.1 hypothetical protein [Vibrio agarilyticus]
MEGNRTKGRIALIALVLVFVIPVLIAKLVLNQHWYQSGASNNGQLFTDYITLENLGQSNPYQQEQWQLVYVLPKSCGAMCQTQLHLLGQSHIALGRHQERVAPVVWQGTEPSIGGGESTGAYKALRMSEALAAKVMPGDLVIVDPLGQLVMRYETSTTTDPMLQSKAVLADLRKLLKLSRVG